ncbi:MAG: hypothetical protein QOE25_1569 [Actinomycetota bacterium]|jgi:hypothetical protein|nr:hypothetical protein [Actinomycetota bacterium]
MTRDEAIRAWGRVHAAFVEAARRDGHTRPAMELDEAVEDELLAMDDDYLGLLLAHYGASSE